METYTFLKQNTIIDTKFVLFLNILRPHEEVTYSELTSGEGQILDMGRLEVPFGVLSVTTHMMPSLPGCTLVITAVGHWSGVVLSSLIRTRSPGCRFGTALCHR